MEHGLKTVENLRQGPEVGREAAIRSLQASGLEVTAITDITPDPATTAAARPSGGGSREGRRWPITRVLCAALPREASSSTSRRKCVSTAPLTSATRCFRQHGMARRRQSQRLRDIQLRAKQRARRMYGVLEVQFRHYFELAESATGVTGTVLLQQLDGASTTWSTDSACGIPQGRRASWSTIATSPSTGRVQSNTVAQDPAAMWWR